jgi:6-phosphofructokinase 1
MRRIAVLTSGGDAPGMNAAIRAVVRCAAAQGWEVLGVAHGYAGLITGDMRPLSVRDVGGILQRGGTILGSARSREFQTVEGRETALRQLNGRAVDALVVIGGNGSQTGAHHLAEMGFRVVGVASTIDNDLVGSDITIGVDTALNIALEAIDRLKTTASSHQRAFLVEVMGRHCGYLALMAALAGGAEAVVLPEMEADPEALGKGLGDAYRRGKAHALIVVAEGAKYNADAMAAYFRERRATFGFDLRVTTLGHVQRGGTPGAFDRVLATRLGAGAVDALARGERAVLVGYVKGAVATTPLSEVVGRQKGLDLALVQLNEVLAR